MCTLEEVTHWAKRKCLGSAPDPMEPGVANLIVALGNNPWPCTLRLARVLVALDQKLCYLTEAMNSTNGCFKRKRGLEAPHYYLTPVYTEAPYVLSDARLQAGDGTATTMGVAAFGVSPRDNTVNLSVSKGAMSNLMLHCLLHLSVSLVLIPPQLSLPTWTGMRRAKIWYESFICFPTAYLPPNISESECNSQQLMLMSSLQVPDPQVLLVIGTVYPNIPLSSASLHGHPRSSLGAALGVRMSATAYGNLSTVSSV